jgi:hypothetical protein
MKIGQVQTNPPSRALAAKPLGVSRESLAVDQVSLSTLQQLREKGLAKAEQDVSLRGQSGGDRPPLFGLGGKLFPDSHGRITHLALQLGNVEFDKPLPSETKDALLTCWGKLMTSLPSAHFSIVCADAAGEDSIRQLIAEQGIDSQRISILGAKSEKGMSIWIRDSMLPLVRDGHTQLSIQDRTYWPGPEDNRVAPLLDQAHSHISSQDHPALRIDGGNVLSNQRHTFVGSDSVRHTRERLQELAQDPQRRGEIEAFYREKTGLEPGPGMWEELPQLVFENEFGRPVVVVARHREQPAFHIDMTMTPIGNDKFLVGDPGMAIDRLRQLSPSEKAEVNAAMARQAGITSGEDLVEKLIEANSQPAKQCDYDATAAELMMAGYEVERVPALMGLRTTWSVPYLTYNNCMMEEVDGQRRVLLPQYGCAPLDEMAQRIYQRNGYQVVPLEMGAISKLEGAIRCSSYALERENWD